MNYSISDIRKLAKRYHVQMVGINDGVVIHLTDNDISEYISYVEKSQALKEERPVFNSSPSTDSEVWVQNKLKDDYENTLSALADSFWSRFKLANNEIYGIRFNAENFVIVVLEQDHTLQVCVVGVA